MQTHFTAIQQEVIANHQQWQNNPVPPPAPEGGKGLYRLERTFPDSDGDGLSDAFEFSVGSQPDNNDENGNGIPDGQKDGDRDGLTNQDEEILGTDPINVPTAQEIEDELNRISGLQANIYFEVTLNEVEVAYDVGHHDPAYPAYPAYPDYSHWGIDGEFDAFSTPRQESEEEKELKRVAFDSDADLNVYMLPTYFQMHGLLGSRVVPFAKPIGWADNRDASKQLAYITANTD